MATFPDTELESQQVAVHSVPCFERGLPSMVEHPAVVTGQDHERVVAQSILFEAREHLSDDPVKFMDGVTIEPTLAGPLKSFSRCEGMMDVGCSQIEEERFLLAIRHPLDRFSRELRAHLVVVE